MDRVSASTLLLAFALLAVATSDAHCNPSSVTNAAAHESLPRAESSARLGRSATSRHALRPQPIRVQIALVQPIADQNLRALLVDDLFPAAVASLASIIRVWTPLESNLTLPRTCASVNPTTGVCQTFAAKTLCGTTEIPAQYLTGLGSGVSADFVLFVQYNSVPACTAEKTVTIDYCHRLAEDDRPISGIVNVCPAFLKLDYGSQRKFILHVLMHQAGFHQVHMPFWRDEFGDPRVPRQSNGLPIIDSVTGGFSTQNVVQSFTERGHIVNKLVTPHALSFARKHTGCSTLNGVELEDQGSEIGSNWESRVALGEIMEGTIRESSVVSLLTLGAFMDMGWYDVNLLQASTLPWGYQRGCTAATSKCVTNGIPVDDSMFCSTPESNQRFYCTNDRRGFGACNTTTYAAALPAHYQYFSDPKVGGSASLPDYCPIIQPLAWGSCNPLGYSTGVIDQFGSSLGVDSFCFDSTLAIGGVADDIQARCYRADCIQRYQQAPFRVRVTIGTESHICDTDDEQLLFSSYTGYIQCPPVHKICPQHECACSAGGKCIEGVCHCPFGNCATDCVLSEWSAWSSCSAECGPGTQTRTREVISAPTFGGAACGVVEESIDCNLGTCNQGDETPQPTGATYAWETSEWSTCEPLCLRGLKHRDVNCVHTPTGETVGECFCQQEKPVEEKDCHDEEDLSHVCTSTETIGPEGGEVYHEEHMSFKLPPNAVNETLTIKITTYESYSEVNTEKYSDPLPHLLVSPLFEFQPAGLTFKHPAAIRILIPHDKYDSHNEYAVFILSEGSVWKRSNHTSIHKEHDEVFLFGEVEHFSLVAGFQIEDEPIDLSDAIRNGVLLVLLLCAITGLCLFYFSRQDHTKATPPFDWTNIGRSLRGLCMPAPAELRNRNEAEENL